jgi:hypothetical protein
MVGEEQKKAPDSRQSQNDSGRKPRDLPQYYLRLVNDIMGHF